MKVGVLRPCVLPARNFETHSHTMPVHFRSLQRHKGGMNPHGPAGSSMHVDTVFYILSLRIQRFDTYNSLLIWSIPREPLLTSADGMHVFGAPIWMTVPEMGSPR